MNAWMIKRCIHGKLYRLKRELGRSSRVKRKWFNKSKMTQGPVACTGSRAFITFPNTAFLSLSTRTTSKVAFLAHPGSSFAISLSVGGFRILSSYLKTRLSDLMRWN